MAGGSNIWTLFSVTHAEMVASEVHVDVVMLHFFGNLPMDSSASERLTKQDEGNTSKPTVENASRPTLYKTDGLSSFLFFPSSKAYTPIVAMVCFLVAISSFARMSPFPSLNQMQALFFSWRFTPIYPHP
jgi:hypothetical protein